MPVLQLEVINSENKWDLNAPKKGMIQICCTEDDKMDIVENTFHLSPSYQGNKSRNCNNSSKTNFGGTWPRSKVKGNISLPSLWAEIPSSREREVKSEERCIPRSPKISSTGLGTVLEVQKDRDKMSRRSPTQKDEFWEALWSHYDCLMDGGLIASCREASGELSLDGEEVSPDYTWSFTEFIEQFNQLHDWLHKLQSTVASSEEQGDKTDNSVIEELQKVAFRCKLFNEQAPRLDKRYPDMKDEINRRVNLLNNKWEAAEQAVNPHKPQQTEGALSQEVGYQMRCLRKWLRELENDLPPLAVCHTWTLQDLENKQKEQLVLQKKIESRGKYVSTLLKSCDRLVSCRVDDIGPPLSWDAHHIKRVATNLEKRWHTLWLKSLEWQCLIEELLKKYRAGCMPGDPSFELSFSEEPLTKYPRLSGDWEDNFILHHADKTDVMMDTESIDQEVLPIDEHTEEYLNATMQDTCELPEDTNTNDKGVMVGMTGIADLKAECGGNIGRFEIIQDVGYSSESSTHLSNDERQEFIRVYSYSPVCSGPSLISEYAVPNQPKETNEQNEVKKSAPGFPYLPPDKYPSVSFKAWQFGKGEEPFHIFKQKTSSLTAPTSTFYKMTTIDPDAIEDGSEDQLCAKQILDNDSTNPDETIHELANQNNSNSAIKTSQNNVDLSVSELSTSVTQVQLPPEDVRHQLRAWAENPDKDALQKLQKKPTKNAQVREWLHKNLVNKLSDKTKMENDIKSRTLPNSLLVDSSCDASGEYTTNESESEQSSSSADNNGSLVMSRSYTGSVETVIPITEESKNQQEEGSGSADSTSCVTMRNKRKSMKDRPWSVVELNRISNGLRVSPLSTSEGALDALCVTSPQNKNADFRHCSSKWLKGMNKDPALPSEEIFNSNTTGNRPKRNRSRGSLNSASYHSDSGSDDLSPNLSLCRSTYSDQPHFSTPTRRRKLSNLALDKTTIHLSPVHQNQILNAHLSVSSNASNKKRNSQLLSNAQQKPAQLSSVADSDQALTQTEDQSSVSDQVWDGYQDPPYFSEPYSEQALNEEEVRKLIEFGDDYGVYLGCHSDASSFSDGHHLSNKTSHSRPQSFVSTSATEVHIDSDSDIEDLQHIFAESTRHLQKAKSTFKRNMSQNDASNTDYAELIATCQTHLNCLEVIADHLSKGDKTIGSEDFSQITGLIGEWETLKKSILSKHKVNTDRQNSEEYLAIQNSLADLSNKITELTTTPLQCDTTLDLLKQRIATLQTSRSTLQQTKDSLLEISKRIVRLMADADLLTCPLKERFNQLYQKWEDIYEENGTHLTDLQHMYQKWNNCDVLCQQLQESLEKKRTSEVNGEMIASAEKQLSKLRAMLSEVKELLGMGEPWQELSERVAHLQTKMCSKDVGCAPMQTEQRRRGMLFWRTVRFAIPIQLALVLLYCLACLLEPRCCDLVNNLNFSLLPQLRYIRGPPPV